MDAIRISAIGAIGTDDGDANAYVQCDFEPAAKRALVFSPELSGPLCTAFLAAAGHLRMKRKMRGLAVDPPLSMGVADFKLAIGPSSVEVTLIAENQAALAFRMPIALARRLAAELVAAASQAERTIPPGQA